MVPPPAMTGGTYSPSNNPAFMRKRVWHGIFASPIEQSLSVLSATPTTTKKIHRGRTHETQEPQHERSQARSRRCGGGLDGRRSEEHTSELQSRPHLVCRL